MHLILGSLAFVIACLGLIWAALQIQTTNRTIAQAWPDWEGIKSPMPFWLLLGAAVLLSAAAGFYFSQAPAPSTFSSPSKGDRTQIQSLEAEIAELKALLSEATTPAIVKTPGETPKPQATDSPNSPEMPESEAPQSEETASTAPSSTPKVSLPSSAEAPPQVEAMSKSVIQSLISGSVKPLEPIAHRSLLDQFTINPFNFSQLQYGLKFRLEEGYTPIYLTSLRTKIGVTYVWKIQTVKSGPDILERLATADGKVTGFRFDGLQ